MSLAPTGGGALRPEQTTLRAWGWRCRGSDQKLEAPGETSSSNRLSWTVEISAGTPRKKPNLHKTARWDGSIPASRLPQAHLLCALGRERGAEPRDLGKPEQSHPECALGASRGRTGAKGSAARGRRAASRRRPDSLPGVLEEPPATNTAEVSLWSAKASAPAPQRACGRPANRRSGIRRPRGEGGRCRRGPFPPAAPRARGRLAWPTAATRAARAPGGNR